VGAVTNRLADLARYSAQVRSNKMTQELGVEEEGIVGKKSVMEGPFCTAVR